MLNIIPIYGGYSICHDITHNSYNQQTWEFTYVLLWVPGILVIVGTKAAMSVPLDPTPPWPKQLDQCRTGPINLLSWDFESGTLISWVSYVCRAEPWWVEAICKVRYMQQPWGGRRKPVCREGQKPGPQIQRGLPPAQWLFCSSIYFRELSKAANGSPINQTWPTDEFY